MTSFWRIWPRDQRREKQPATEILALWSGYTYDVFAPIVIGDGQVLPDLVKNGQPFNSIKKAIWYTGNICFEIGANGASEIVSVAIP